jgi:hypothetical protein
MKAPAGDRTCIWRSLQLILILLTFGLDFGHGIMLGEHDIAFHPLYRLRQTLAIAISRMHQPPAGGYLAYQSVVDALNENGFAIFNQDKGPHLDLDGSNELVKSPTRLEHALQDAKDAPIDPNLPPQIIRGNEPGYADYVYLAFRLFGAHMASLYFFYFVLLGISCVLFVAEFKRWPFALFLLSAYLAGLFFLQNYVQTQREQLATLANSRVFEALSLLPAMHIFLLVWRGQPFRMPTIATAAAQATLLAFVVESRTAALWQVAMIIAAAATVVLASAVGWRSLSASRKGHALAAIWPAALAVTLLTTGMAAIDLRVDSRYRAEPKAHVIWHEVLRGILSTNLELQRIYVGKVTELADPTDQIAYDAVMKDLNDRNDRSSPIAFNVDGRIYIDPDRGYAEYDRLARSLVLKILAAHPFKVIASIPEKLSEQIEFFRGYTLLSAMRVDNLLIAAVVAALAGILWLGSGAWEVSARNLVVGAAAAAIIFAFALVPPLIAPSNLSVGTLLCFLIATVVGVFILIALVARLAQSTPSLSQLPQKADADAWQSR